MTLHLSSCSLSLYIFTITSTLNRTTSSFSPSPVLFINSFSPSLQHMGYSSNSVGSLVNLSLLISLLLVSSTEVVCLVKGIAISRLLEVAAKVGNEEKMFVRSQIGSRPPSCLRRCSSCGPCQAIQVPAVPQVGSGVKGHSSPTATISSRAEDTSNYKPMNWKCKCGDKIFNP